VNQLVSPLPRATFWVVVLLLLAGSLVTLGGAQAASSPNYVLSGYATQKGGSGLYGTVVELQSRATGQIFSTQVTSSGGAFNFTTASTSGALVPGYWSVWVPAQANVSRGQGVNLCNPCTVLPVNQTPLSLYVNTSMLTTTNYPPVRLTITATDYNSAVKGQVVSTTGRAIGGATVQLLYPQFNDLSLVNNTTASNGSFYLRAPAGSWVLKTTVPGATTYYNVTAVSVPALTTVNVSKIVVRTFLISGIVEVAGGSNPPVPNGGNLTVWDPSNGYIYSSATQAGGFYSFGSYNNLTTYGSQTFYVILDSVGYANNYYTTSVTGPNPVAKNVLVSPLTPQLRGVYNTTLDFATINPATGKGSVSVNTTAILGNNTVLPTLPNASVGQLWSQLGLDFDHSISLSAAGLSDFYAWENASGPFFPAVQAGTAINGTGFLGPTGPQSVTRLSSTTACSTACSLSTAGGVQLGWNTTYQLNGTLATNSSSYTISFGFTHAPSADTYNYTLELPAGYALAAGTAAPANTRLVPLGADKTWTKFTLVSLPSPTPQGSASFSIVKYANLTANVNVTSQNFAFSTANILNATHNNYTVVVGINQNVTFSALNSTYPAGTNGTKFVWNFGDGAKSTVGQPTTNHTYTVASGSSPYTGTLNVTSSGGLVNTTTFFVWVGKGPVTAHVSTNATASQNRTANGRPYLFVNWGTAVSFNAIGSTANISSSAPIPGVISIATFTLVAKGFKVTQNYSVSQGASVDQNYSYTFLGAGVYYTNHTTINGVTIPFKGWQYNLTLLIWSGSGQSGTTTLVVLVNDTEAPTSAFQILNSAGKPVSGSGVIAAANLTARIYLNAANATDPHNGSITKYYWQISNSGNSSAYRATNQTTVKAYPTFWLAPQLKPYTINLTVWDLNGNKGWTNQSLSVSVNSTISPIMAAGNLTAPTTYNSGTSYTIWVNLTAGGGAKSTAQNVTVSFYLTSPTGTSRTYIGGSPSSVKFYNFTSGVVNTVPFATGLIASMVYGTTYRAEIQWTPSSTGNFVLYANVTASNEYSGNYINGPQTLSQSVTVNPNPTTQLLEYVAIAVAVIVVIFLIVVLYRRRTGRSGTTKSSSGGRSGLERGKSKSSDDTDDDEDDES
jgi:PKD domain